MKTTLSSRGQVVLPAAIRRRLGLEAGATLEVETEEGHIVLKPVARRPAKTSIKTSPATGLPLLVVNSATTLTSEQVKEFLADFP